MKLVFEPDHLDLLSLISEACSPNQQPYLVGGAVRDALLGQPLHDMDFVMAENPTSLGKKLAHRLGAGFFVLDDERNTARVVYHLQDGSYFPLDFVQFTGRDLVEDLHNRDFTINAMAVPVRELTQLIDPLDGHCDLNQNILRVCSNHALSDDPVRVLRAVRLAVQIKLTYAPGLKAALQSAASLLPKTSPERQRDEFFRLLSGPDPALGLQHLQRLGIFAELIPPLARNETITTSPGHQFSVSDHAVITVQHYHSLLKVLVSRKFPEGTDPSLMQEAVRALNQFTDQIGIYFKSELTPGRSKASLAFLGALLQDVGRSPVSDVAQSNHEQDRKSAALAYQIAKRLPLSNAESVWVQTLVQYHQHLLPVINTCNVPDRRTVFHFFKLTGEVGVAIALHTLADILAKEDSTLDLTRWKCALAVVQMCLHAWWEAPEDLVTPQPLLDGNHLQQEFGLTPGKVIGRLLNQLVEEQASGTIINLDQAREFINNQLSDHLEHGENNED